MVYQNGGVQGEPTLKLRPFTSAEEIEYRKAQSKGYQSPMPTYGFVGRDLDILEVERRLLIPHEGITHNILLLQGMGGSGKTTLLRHLMEWWQTTGFVQEVFYFGYDERAWNREQIMNEVAQELLADKIDAFRALDLESQQKMLGQKMRSQRNLLVLDNMESITGSSMAIRNTLSNKERQELKAFLAELLGGDTLVLLGSRSNEEWLTEGSGALLSKNDIYHLSGLDDQAATILAERVLERHIVDVRKRDTYRQSEEFQELMKLLDGYPLPIQVVLVNLVNQTPEQVLNALKEGGALQDPGQHKTESLMLCIEYSHGNLAPDDQKVLMTLAPFTGMVCRVFIDHYIEYLRQQPALIQLPFQRLNGVIQQAQEWGLITTDRMEGYLRLQPMLPYFLRIRLRQEPELQHVVEDAYRTLYDDITAELLSPIESKDTRQKQAAQILVQHEYENLCAALELDLKAHGSIIYLANILFHYLDEIHDQKKELEICQKILVSRQY